jgi:phosphate transport system substrate-binding protein
MFSIGRGFQSRARTRGRCTNIDYCGIAAGRHPVDVRLGDEFICPECARPLVAPSPREISGLIAPLLVALIVALLLVGGGVILGYHLAGGTASLSSGGSTGMESEAPSGARAAVMMASQTLTTRNIVDAEQTLPGSEADLRLRIQGSLSIGAVASRLGQVVLAEAGDADVSASAGDIPGAVLVSGQRAGRRHLIEITTDGADDAFAALARGDADIVLSSRAIRQSERDLLRSLIDGGASVEGVEIARRGVAVIVGPAVTLGRLTSEQVRGILRGSIVAWPQLGINRAARIHLLSDRGLAAEDLCALAPGADPVASAQSVDYVAGHVAADPDAIGLVGLDQIGHQRALPVGEAGGHPVAATARSVADGSYKLVLPIYLYRLATATNTLADRFNDVALSPAGRVALAQSGLTPIAGLR